MLAAFRSQILEGLGVRRLSSAFTHLGVRDSKCQPANESRLSPPTAFRTLSNCMQSEIPVIVPCFNNPTYTSSMVRQLRDIGFRNIVLLDCASTSSDMRSWLASLSEQVSVVVLQENYGPRHAFLNPASLALLPRHFCVTDPDLAFNARLPADFLGQLAALIEREKIGKAGFALDIEDREALRDELFRIGEKDWKIWEWEGQFWNDPINPLTSGDPVYRANIDTTFALYDRNYFDCNNYLSALRVAGKYTAKHLPWYRDKGIPEREAEYYSSTQKFSFYMK